MLEEIEPLINNKLKTDFERELFQASLNLIKNTNSPLRYNTFALSFREFIRHLFNRLAPDNKVLRCPWYQNEMDRKNGITRKQRMLYAIKGGLSDDFIQTELNFNLNTVTRTVTKVIENLNKYTHIEMKTFNIDSQVGDELVFESLTALNEFLETIDIFRDEIISAYEIRLSELIDDALISDTIQEIDILSTHYWIDGSWIEDISIEDIDDEKILVFIYGSIYVQHQYGSDMDYKRGDGLRTVNSYPFKLSTIIDVEFPLEISINAEDIEVDNSKFYT